MAGIGLRGYAYQVYKCRLHWAGLIIIKHIVEDDDTASGFYCIIGFLEQELNLILVVGLEGRDITYEVGTSRDFIPIEIAMPGFYPIRDASLGNELIGYSADIGKIEDNSIQFRLPLGCGDGVSA